MSDDLVGVRIGTVNGPNGLVIVQRRSEAEKTIAQLAESRAVRESFRDVVGNPVVIECAPGMVVCIVPVHRGAALAQELAPIPPGFDLAALVPETIEPPPRGAAASAERRVTAADVDPLEEFNSGIRR